MDDGISNLTVADGLGLQHVLGDVFRSLIPHI